MRYPIYSKGFNPSTASPLLKKKLAYVTSLVCDRYADWVDAEDIRRGVILRGPRIPNLEIREKQFGTFDSAWSLKPSGLGNSLGSTGPLVWQFNA